MFPKVSQSLRSLPSITVSSNFPSLTLSFAGAIYPNSPPLFGPSPKSAVELAEFEFIP